MKIAVSSFAIKTLLLLPGVVLLSASRVRAEDFAAERKDDRLIITRGGKPLAHFVFGDPQIRRPYFAHVHTLSGVPVTRAHPPVEGKDPVDHAMMHPGIWLAFGDINGHDFWRNKAAIRHEKFTQEPAMKHGALTFATVSKLVPAQGAALAEMSSVFTFSTSTNGWLLAWDATFAPLVDGFYFGDQEEMGLGVRMATALSETQGGTITSSTGRKGAKDTWGQLADWCDYSGAVDGKKCGVLLMASPENFRQSWFHNRDYGLMVANPFGKKAFTKVSEPSKVAVENGKTLRLRYGVLVHDGELPKDHLWEDWK